MRDFFSKFKNQVYLDYNATTPPCKEAIEGWKEASVHWSNPSSIYQKSRDIKVLLWEARKQLSQALNCSPLELIFTSGATESNNHVFKGLKPSADDPNRKEIIISSVEHPSVLQPALQKKAEGLPVHIVPVSQEGCLDMEFFNQVLSEKTLLVSIMRANNETGILFPIKELAKQAREKGSLFHSDMVQSLGKEPVDLKQTDLDFASFSAHKAYAFKGCGLLYARKGARLQNLIEGGPQERKRRAGTENTPGILAFSGGVKILPQLLAQQKKIRELRNDLELKLCSKIKGVKIIGVKQERLSNTSCFHIPGVEGQSLLMNLDLKGFSVSLGSACQSGKITPSSVLISMGFKEEEAASSIRVSLGKDSQKKSIDFFVQTLGDIVERLR